MIGLFETLIFYKPLLLERQAGKKQPFYDSPQLSVQFCIASGLCVNDSRCVKKSAHCKVRALLGVLRCFVASP